MSKPHQTNDIISCWHRHPIDDQLDPYGPYITYPCFSCKQLRTRTRLIIHRFTPGFTERNSFLCTTCICHIRSLCTSQDNLNFNQVFFCDLCFSNYFDIIEVHLNEESFESFSVVKKFPPSTKTKSAYKTQ